RLARGIRTLHPACQPFPAVTILMSAAGARSRIPERESSVFATQLRLAACAAALAMFALPAQALVHGAYHIFPTPASKAKLAKKGAPPSAADMNYYGGSVFTSPRVVTVIWGPDVNPTIVSTVPGFSAAIVNSTYVDQMAEYNTKGAVAINGHKS